LPRFNDGNLTIYNTLRSPGLSTLVATLPKSAKTLLRFQPDALPQCLYIWLLRMEDLLTRLCFDRLFIASLYLKFYNRQTVASITVIFSKDGIPMRKYHVETYKFSFYCGYHLTAPSFVSYHCTVAHSCLRFLHYLPRDFPQVTLRNVLSPRDRNKT
jgi:hypothetical protein